MTPVHALSSNVALSAPALRHRRGFFVGVLFLGALLILAWGSWRDAAVADTGIPADLIAAAAELGVVVPVQATAVEPSRTPSQASAGRAAPEPVAARAYVPVEAPAEATPRTATRRAATEVEAPPAIVIPSLPETAPVAAATPSPAVILEASAPDPVLDAELAAVTSLVADVISSSDAAVSRARSASADEFRATTPVETAEVASAPSPSPLVAASLAPEPVPVTAAAAPAVSQCNGTDNVGGEAVECHVTVTNNYDYGTGETTSTVEVTECHGAANDPPTLVCSPTTTTAYDGATTSVDQCNGSGNGGGGTVKCTVEVVNNVNNVPAGTPLDTFDDPTTVNQCNVSGQGGGTEPTTLCDPSPATTTNADVTQCNGSGNGGGGTERVQCNVYTDPGRDATELLPPVTVNQCNGSGNEGGATVTCSTKITNNITFTPAPPDGGTDGGTGGTDGGTDGGTGGTDGGTDGGTGGTDGGTGGTDGGTGGTGGTDGGTGGTDGGTDGGTGGTDGGGALPANLPGSTVPQGTLLGGAPLPTSSLLTPAAITPAGLTGASLASVAVVDAGGPSSVPRVASASSVAELVPAQSQAPARVLALTGVDSTWVLMVAWFTIALGALAVRLSGPRTIRLRTTGGRRTVR